MSAPTGKIGCVVVSLRKDRDTVILKTSDGEVVIEVNPLTMSKTRVVVRAPVDIEILRRPKEVQE